MNKPTPESLGLAVFMLALAGVALTCGWTAGLLYRAASAHADNRVDKTLSLDPAATCMGAHTVQPCD